MGSLYRVIVMSEILCKMTVLYREMLRAIQVA